MGPDRIIVGEVRGDEVLDMLQAMNTGHDGSMTTLHANSTRDAIHRMELLAGFAGYTGSETTFRGQVAAAIQLLDRKSVGEGKRGSVRVDLGWRRTITKKRNEAKCMYRRYENNYEQKEKNKTK